MKLDETDYLRLGVFLGKRYPKLSDVASFKIFIMPPNLSHQMQFNRLIGSPFGNGKNVEYESVVIQLEKIALNESSIIWCAYDEIDNVVILQEER